MQILSLIFLRLLNSYQIWHILQNQCGDVNSSLLPRIFACILFVFVSDVETHYLETVVILPQEIRRDCIIDAQSPILHINPAYTSNIKQFALGISDKEFVLYELLSWNLDLRQPISLLETTHFNRFEGIPTSQLRNRPDYVERLSKFKFILQTHSIENSAVRFHANLYY